MDTWVMNNRIFETVTGSHSYGFATETSDTDIRGITIPPEEYWIGLYNFEQQIVDGDDYTIYGIEKFFKLAMNANPNILELLFIEPRFYRFINKYGEKLISNRELFLSKKVRKSYSSYAVAQLKRIQGHYKWMANPPIYKEPTQFGAYMNKTGSYRFPTKEDKREYERQKKEYLQYKEWFTNRNPERHELEVKYNIDTKHLCHLVRLYRTGIEILRDSKLKVLRPDADELKAIKNGAWTYEYAMEQVDVFEKEIEDAYNNSNLPHSPDVKKISGLMQEIVRDYLFNKER